MQDTNIEKPNKLSPEIRRSIFNAITYTKFMGDVNKPTPDDLAPEKPYPSPLSEEPISEDKENEKISG